MNRNFKFKIFTWTGLIVKANKSFRDRITNYIFYIYIIATVFDVFGSLVASDNISDLHALKVTFTYLTSYFLTIITWYLLWWKRYEFSTLLRHIERCSVFIYTKKIRCLMYLITAILPLVYVSLTVTNEIGHGYYCSYGYNFTNTYAILAISGTRCSMYAIIYPVLSDMLVCQYCTLCIMCTKSIFSLRCEIERCTIYAFDIPKQVDILKRESRILDLLLNFQTVFSTPSFLMFATHYCVCSSMLGWIVLGEHVSDTKFLLTLLYFANSLACLFVFVWVPGQLPIEMDKFKEVFRRKSRQRWMLLRIAEEDVFGKAFIEKPTLTFSGCDIITFRRNSILAIIGTILTYTLLVVT